MRPTTTDLSIRFGLSDSFRSSEFASWLPSEFESVSESVKRAANQRDHGTCRCCGFTSEKYQQIVLLRNNPRDIDNVATVCIFCQQCFYMDAAIKMRSGVLVWLPEFDQAAVHHIARDIYRARISQGPTALIARSLLQLIMERRHEVRERLGTDDPYLFADKLLEWKHSTVHPDQAVVVEGVRLFPLDRRILREGELEYNQFPQILAYLRSSAGPFRRDQSYSWLTTAERKLADTKPFPTPL